MLHNHYRPKVDVVSFKALVHNVSDISSMFRSQDKKNGLCSHTDLVATLKKVVTDGTYLYGMPQGPT